MRFGGLETYATMKKRSTITHRRERHTQAIDCVPGLMVGHKDKLLTSSVSTLVVRCSMKLIFVEKVTIKFIKLGAQSHTRSRSFEGDISEFACDGFKLQ